jgi:DnaJ-class molecular chaperone
MDIDYLTEYADGAYDDEPRPRKRDCAAGCGISALPGSPLCAECLELGRSPITDHVTYVPCPACQGSGEGFVPATNQWREQARCRDCGGYGKVTEAQAAAMRILGTSRDSKVQTSGAFELPEEDASESPQEAPGAPETTCPACDGSGCRFCVGRGRVSLLKSARIRALLEG